ANLLRRFALRGRALLNQLLGPLGCRLAGMDCVDMHAIADAESREPLGEICRRGIDGAANEELGLDGARRAADDVDDMALRSLEQRPEQSGQTHRPEEFQRKTIKPELVRKLEKISRPRRACVVDQNIAAADAFIDALE